MIDPNFDFDQIIFKGEISQYLDYLETLDEFLDTENQKHKASLQKLEYKGRDIYSDDGQPSDEAGYDLYIIDRFQSFSAMLRSSFFVNIYSFFEIKLIEECSLRKSEEIQLSLSELAGQDNIDKANIYFKKVLKLDFPSNTPEWEEIQNYQLLRNCIVHCQGRLDKIKKLDHQKIRAYITRQEHISLMGDYIDLSKEFCLEACTTIESFLQKMLFQNSK